MTQYKFRAWDGAKMHFDVVPWQWDFVISRSWHRCEKSNGSGILGGSGTEGEFLVPGIAFKELMQFTPIKDQHDKDIYEGDILKDTLTGRVFEVRFGFCKKYAFTGFYCETSDGYQAALNCDDGSDINSQIEVIGNIYEHTELIK